MGLFKDIDYSLANDNFYYDETSPSFLRWKVQKGNSKVGDIAGHYSNTGYYRVKLAGEQYAVHRIIWVLFNGEIDSNLTIDHNDRNRANNNINNLRLVDHKQNMNNKKDYKRANKLPKHIYYNGSRVDNNGRNYLRAIVKDPITNKRVSKSGYDLQELLLWLEAKKAEFGIVN